MSPDSLLLRQIHPDFIQNGRVTSQAFKPTPKDEGQLSVYDGEDIEPYPAYEHYTAQLKLSSAGVLAITSKECEKHRLQVVKDGVPYPEHGYIDFTSLSESEAKKKAKLLAAAAMSRGWLYKAAPTS